MLTYNPLLQFGFDDIGEAHIFIKDEEGNEIDITEYVVSLKTQIDGKVNIFQGSTQGNKVMITDPQGNITTVAGVVMNQAERDKLANLSNPMLLKGILNSYEALYQVSNPQVGWCYLVPFAGENDNIYKEYVYTANNEWEVLGNFNASVIPQYLSGTATEVDNLNQINLKYDEDVFSVDSNNRLKLKDLSYVAKCKTLAEINALSVGDTFHWQGANDQTIVTVDPDGTPTYIKYGYFYKKGENSTIQRINKDSAVGENTDSQIVDNPTSPNTRVKTTENDIQAFGKLYLGRHWQNDNAAVNAITVGAGTSSNDKANIATLTWDGTAWVVGDVTCGGTAANPQHRLSNKLDKQAIINNFVLDYSDNAEVISYVNARNLAISLKSMVLNNIAQITLIQGNTSTIITNNNIQSLTINANTAVKFVITRTTENQAASCGITYSYQLQ